MNLFAVLVRTEHPQNIGAAARALANMGGNRLILVDPRCELNSKAFQMAAGAQDMVRSLTIYKTWTDFYEQEPDGLRIALTRRCGHNRKVLPLLDQLTEVKKDAPDSIYLVFGPEADGLAADDLALINWTCHLPVYSEFGSLNLAQAVMLACYLVRSQFPPKAEVSPLKGENAAIQRPFYFPDQLIKEWLTAMGFDISARKASAYLTLRRLFLQNRPTQHEIQVLDSILQQNIRKLRERSVDPTSLGLTAEELADQGSDITGQ